MNDNVDYEEIKCPKCNSSSIMDYDDTQVSDDEEVESENLYEYQCMNCLYKF